MANDVDDLAAAIAPTDHYRTLIFTDGHAYDAALAHLSQKRYRVFSVDMVDVRDSREILNALFTAISAPKYDLNWNAFHDWMTDLAWFEETYGYFLLVENARRLWTMFPAEAGTFAEVMHSAAESWCGKGKASCTIFLL
jgi:hypothetical protein